MGEPPTISLCKTKRSVWTTYATPIKRTKKYTIVKAVMSGCGQEEVIMKRDRREDDRNVER